MSQWSHNGNSPAALVVAVVAQGKGAQVVKAAKAAHGVGGFVFYGRGTASEEIWERLGITEHREIVMCSTLFHHVDAVMQAINDLFDYKKRDTGIVFAVSINKFLGRNVIDKIIQKVKQAGGPLANLALEQSDEMQQKVEDIMAQYTEEKLNAQQSCRSELIIVRMANGYGQEVMDCARKAGAIGGTIVHGRMPLDRSEVKFFNITIEPEGDVLFMLTPKDISGQVLDAIAEKYGPTTPAHAFGFVVPVLKASTDK